MSALRDGDNVPLEDVLDRFVDARFEELDVAMPGRVVSYDAAAQTVDVTPMVNGSVQRRDGSRRSEPLPTIRAVPVIFPGGGDWFLRFPIAAGDEVLLVVCDRDPARWRVTGEQSDPIDVRGHHMAHAVAIPGLRSRPNALPAPSGSAIEFGMVGGSTVRIEADGTIRAGGVGATDLVPLSSLVAAQFTAIAAKIAELDAQIVIAGGGSSPPYTPGAIASTKLRAL